ARRGPRARTRRAWIAGVRSPDVGSPRVRWPGVGSSRAERGAALVLVLVVAALLGLVALSLAFTVTLDTLAARNVQEEVLAEGQAEAALALALETATASGGAGAAPGVRFGPWPDQGISASVEAAWDVDGTVRLRSRAVVGRSGVTRTLVARVDDGVGAVVISRP
ncbi:MAG: hypothetical protein P8Y13_11585, partial [Deinococcales bacterium]